MHRWLPAGCRWVRPYGGMFFWLTLPSGLDATALLAKAVDAGVAYVPGAAFYSADARADTLRLSFVTVDTARIEEGVRLLGGVLAQALERMPAQEIRA